MPDTPLPPCRITVDDEDLCELAFRLPTEAEQNAALADIPRRMRAREGQR